MATPTTLWFALLLCLTTFSGIAYSQGSDGQAKPIRALLIAGGCCHDYAKQQEALCKGIQARARVQVDVYWTDNSTTAPVLPLYTKLNWAADYDVIIHDECAADVKDPAMISRIVNTHQTIPAVHLHCAMHSFRGGNDVWFKHLGLQSSGHGPQEPIDIAYVDKKHPITESLGDWTTIKEELYNNVKMFDAHPLAIGKQKVGKGDKERVDEAVVAWINESQGARSFSTTIGHNTETVQDDRYLDLVTRGLLWACNKLSPEYLKPYDGENKVTFIDKMKFSNGTGASLGTAPKNATLAKVTASSTQSGNATNHAIDGKQDSRWCADGASFPQWIQLEFEKSLELTGIAIDWEMPNGAYRYRVEGSTDGERFETLLDRSDNRSQLQGVEPFPAKGIRFLRVTGLGSTGGWCSIREIRVTGGNVESLWPAQTQKDSTAFVPVQQEVYAKSGNAPPRIVPLTRSQEEEILRDVQIPDGFEATVFAAPPAVNYPVFVAAAVDGTLFVSSDGNGSLGRDPMRGRVIRLKDTNGDGRADETKVFCEIDAPRGLVWDRDRLYLMHPPHLSAFIDKDGDGVADEQKILVKNLAFDYDQRPADHTTNGVSLGLDGWLYIAGGDFGFVNAEGTDGRRLTHRGGGVIRVRPDGTGLELYSTGTRNILEVAISPKMEMFARDNTNDGGGWDVRMHHFTGNDDHGYPRLYKNFAEECVQPLADYGGGSGCGATYVSEPGFGKWNDAPFTADWGTGAIYRHSVEPRGSTYVESKKPEPFIRMTRPTVADIDGYSRIYCASWKGATFDWNGPDVGYIVCVKPKDFVPEPWIDPLHASDEKLVQELESNSYRRRLAANRELTFRKSSKPIESLRVLLAQRHHDRNLLDDMSSNAPLSFVFSALASSDPLVVHTAVRCLAKRQASDESIAAIEDRSIPIGPLCRALGMMHDGKIVDALVQRIEIETDAVRRQAMLGSLCRLHYREGKWKGDSWGTRPDTRGPYYQPESWEQTSRIFAFLTNHLEKGPSDDAPFLADAMQRNRIESSNGLERIMGLAQNDERLLSVVVLQLATAKNLPNGSFELLQKAIRSKKEVSLLGQAIVALSKGTDRASVLAMLDGMAQLSDMDGETEWRGKAQLAFLQSHAIEPNIAELISIGTKDPNSNKPNTLPFWADAAVLAIAGRPNLSPETNALVQSAIEEGLGHSDRRIRLVQIAGRINSHFLDEQILEYVSSNQERLASVAKNVAKRLQLKPRPKDNTPKLSTLGPDEALQKVISTTGDISLGQALFAKAKCAQCHTVRQDEAQKGPYLGNIAKTYKRPELATAIVEPSKTLAQGFITNILLTEDDEVFSGFITDEQNDKVTMRDSTGKEITILKSVIVERKTSTTSSMPTGLMNDFTVLEFASLLDYLQSLAP